MSGDVAALSDEAVVRYVLRLGPLATLEQNPLALQKAAATLFEVHDGRQMDEADVKRTFKKLVLRVHPDKNRAANAHEAFQIVHTCFEFLLRRPAFVSVSTTSVRPTDKTRPPPPRAPAPTFTTRPVGRAKDAVPLTRMTSSWLPRTFRPAKTTTTTTFARAQTGYVGGKDKNANLYRRTVSSTRAEATPPPRPTFSYAAWGAARLRRSAAQWREVERWASSIFDMDQREKGRKGNSSGGSPVTEAPAGLRRSPRGAGRGLPPRRATRGASGVTSPLANALASHLSSRSSASYTPPPFAPLPSASSSADSDLFAAVRVHTSSSAAVQLSGTASPHASQVKTTHSRTLTHTLSSSSSTLSSSSSSSPFSSSASTHSAFAATASCVLDRHAARGTARRAAHRPALPARPAPCARAISHATPSSSTVSSPAFASLGMTV